jgi:8-oxo-dGTP pyrophosphatase MutT (NUDIX family)
MSIQIIKAEKNLFGGVVVESGDLPEDPAEFDQSLEQSLSLWRSQGVKVVWLDLERRQAALIPAAAARGFVFHHAQEDRLQMIRVLVPGSTVPPFATHYVGAGGVVVREDGNILVVSERYKQVPGRRLKLPGGALLAGEHINTAVVREVKEETGIDAAFESVVCFRHWHGYRYGKSDIYFVCRLRALSTEISMDSRELVECLWIEPEAYLGDADVHGFNKMVVRAALDPGNGLARRFIPEYNDDVYELIVP